MFGYTIRKKLDVDLMEMKISRLEESLKQAQSMVDYHKNQPVFCSVAKDFQSKTLDRLLKYIWDDVVRGLSPILRREFVHELNRIRWPQVEHSHDMSPGPAIISAAYELTRKEYEIEIRMPALGHHMRIRNFD